MKKIRRVMAVVLSVIMLMALVACNDTQEEFLVAADRAQAWVQEQMKNNTLFSFDYDGKAYGDHIKSWDKTVEKTENGQTVTYKKDGVVAWAEITLDKELAALEWTCYFKNEGTSDSKVIGNILPLSSTVSVPNAVFTTANGSTASGNDFSPLSVDIASEGFYSMKSFGGRSSDTAFPYFDLSNGEYGSSMLSHA